MVGDMDEKLALASNVTFDALGEGEPCLTRNAGRGS